MGDLAPQVHKKCLRYLYRICGRQAFLPRSLEVPLCYDPKKDPVSRGELADVWKGQYQGQEVAARVFSIWRGSDAEEIKKVSCRWRSRPAIQTTDHVLEILQGNCNVEGPSPSECVATVGRDND